LAQRGAYVTVLTDTAHEMPNNDAGGEVRYSTLGSAVAAERLHEARQVIAWTNETQSLGADHVRLLQAGTYLIDASIGAIGPEGIEEAYRCGVLPIRVNIWPALAGALLAAHESARISQTALGWGTRAGTSIVAGGALGRRGDVIVDSVHEPTRVIGVADGRGGVVFNYSPGEADAVRRVSEEIQLAQITRHAPLLGMRS
jgi:hypothetical protein